MIALLHFLQRKLRPEITERPTPSRYLLMSDVVGLLYSIPLMIFGLLWLVALTNWSELWSHWRWMFVILAAIIVFSRLRYFMVHSLRKGHIIGSDGDFVGVILWTSLLIFGHSIIWLFVFWNIVELYQLCRQSINRDMRWNSIRSAVLNTAALLISALFSLMVYQNLGGQFPISGLNIESLLPAIAAVLSFAIIYFLTWLPFILYIIWVQERKFEYPDARGLFWFSILTLELPFITLLFGIVASGIYIEHGPIIFGIYFIGLLLMALLANQLSRSAEKSRRQADQLMGLERLGREIIAAPTDARDLPVLLRKRIPEMFPSRRAVVWLSPETYLLKYPDGKDNYTPAIWDWLLTTSTPQGFLENVPLPWENAPERHFSLLTAPILDPISGETIGGLFVELISFPQRWDRKTLEDHFPALQNLAAQIASALKQAENYQETLKHQRVNQELRLAGEIQSSFLPDRAPEIDGWDIAAMLKPARQTSGDFYDFFDLEDGRLGILIADVADKGLGAALYMALGRTLLLTYAQVYPENPAAVLQATNRRMLSDARAQMFITAFYGVLEPENGRLIYCNAGHHPPILIRNNLSQDMRKLKPNGMALGIDENAAWVAISQRIEVDDTLLLYTDGLVEANNASGAFYGVGSLIESTQKVANRPSQWILRAVMEDLQAFQTESAQSDDITLVCIRRRQ